MKVKPLFILLILLALIGIAVWASRQEGKPLIDNPSETFESRDYNGKTGLNPGNRAPNFTLTSLDGQKIALDDYRGKKVILNFWQTSCVPCRKEMPALQKYYKKYQAKDVEILAINLTYNEKNRDDIESFVKEYDAWFPILLDQNAEAVKKYEILSAPTSYIIDSKGIIQKKHLGPMSYAFINNIIGKIK
ncbi:TlpA disulfide reductase family protein [Fictibacillus sp. Mic-4]|uniref:TlpA disulfide reductase family protein n=1 Tax=Fictibacillus sp. Mic-4 TaxID=3132826 RepID=UPI003CEB7952